MACVGVHQGGYLGGYCAAKSPLVMQPVTLMVPKDHPRQSMCGVLMTSGHAPFPTGSGAIVMVDICLIASLGYQMLNTYVNRTMRFERYIPIYSTF